MFKRTNRKRSNDSLHRHKRRNKNHQKLKKIYLMLWCVGGYLANHFQNVAISCDGAKFLQCIVNSTDALSPYQWLLYHLKLGLAS